jgi:hypothetical protein
MTVKPRLAARASEARAIQVIWYSQLRSEQANAPTLRWVPRGFGNPTYTTQGRNLRDKITFENAKPGFDIDRRKVPDSLNVLVTGSISNCSFSDSFAAAN